MRKEFYTGIWLTLICLVMVGCSRRELTAEQMEQMMSAEVPVGSDASRAISFYVGRQIEHSGIVQLKDEDRNSPDTLFGDPKLNAVRHRIQSYVPAIKRDVGGKGFLTRWDILMRFYLDGDGKVVAHQAKKIGTSL